MTTYFLLFFIISTSGSFTCHDLPVSVEIRFRSRESLFLDQNHTGRASLIAIAELFTRNDNYIISTSLRKHAYSSILKISPPKTEFSDKNSDIFFFHISAQNMDCGYSLELSRRGSSNEYPQSMF